LPAGAVALSLKRTRFACDKEVICQSISVGKTADSETITYLSLITH
jgi:hypothetical protein